jgi:lantibiotic modifying enzyme
MLDHDDYEQLVADARIAVSTTLGLELGGNHSLCHGDLGNLELPFTMAHRFDDSALAAQIASRIGTVLAAIEADKLVSGGPLGIETPDLMNGIAGTGLALLRFARPDAVPSVLMLEAPVRRDPSTLSAIPTREWGM